MNVQDLWAKNIIVIIKITNSFVIRLVEKMVDLLAINYNLFSSKFKFC